MHVPEGATPKDGPSAGVAMVTSIVSVLTGVPVKKSIAMTGEITLRGRVLPIGGLKEKMLAALRGGLTTVLIPQENEKDLDDIPDNVKKDITIVSVDSMDDILKHALTGHARAHRMDRRGRRSSWRTHRLGRRCGREYPASARRPRDAGPSPRFLILRRLSRSRRP